MIQIIHIYFKYGIKYKNDSVLNMFGSDLSNYNPIKVKFYLVVMK